MLKWILVAVVVVPALSAVVAFAPLLTLWLQLKAAAIPVSLVQLLMMKLRGLYPDVIMENMIQLWKAGIEVPVGELEAHVLAGGDLADVTNACISADKADLGVDFRTIAAIDLAGRDVVDAVNTRVNPKVLLCPPAGTGQEGITGVSRDGIRLVARARVTVRTELSQLVGGAGEETIIARVGEGIVAAMGGADSHRDILERPEIISEHLLAKGLDSGTCFEILSVDIADVDVLDNVAAILSSSRAEADKRIAQAQAEMRRAAAVAARQEMTARTVQMQSRVESAKSTVPLAVSSAVREANMGRRIAMVKTVNPRMRWKRADV